MTTGIHDLLLELTELRETQAKLANNEALREQLDRLELVRLRRSLAERLSTIAKIAPVALQSRGEKGLAETFHQRFSVMRSAVALHQSQWSAAWVDHANADYQKSVASVQKSNKEFTDWAINIVEKARE